MPLQVVRKDPDRKARFESLERSDRLVREKIGDWRQEFPGEVVVVHDGHVVARETSAEKAWTEVAAQDVPPERCLMVRIPRDDVLAFY